MGAKLRQLLLLLGLRPFFDALFDLCRLRGVCFEKDSCFMILGCRFQAIRIQQAHAGMVARNPELSFFEVHKLQRHKVGTLHR